MKLILIIFVFIFGCITDEASHCEKLRSDRRSDTCYNSIIIREGFYESDEEKGLSPRTDPNSRGNQYLNYVLYICLAEYKEGEECRKKSHIKPVRSR
jgi:hypothetical protein